jgi:hypothetical protein
MRHVHTNQDGFWIEVNGKYQEIQYSSRTRLVGIDCTITFDMSQQDRLQSPKMGDLFVGLEGINDGFKEGEVYEIIEEVEEDNMLQCIKADGSGSRMYIHTKYMGAILKFKVLEKNNKSYCPHGRLQYSLTLTSNQLKKVTVAPKYKRGDVLVFTGRTKHYVCYKPETVVTIIRTHKGALDREWGYIHVCMADDGNVEQHIPEDALEPIKPTPKEVVNSLTMIQKGDIVMVTGKSLGYAHSDLSYGDIIKVHKVRGGILHYWHDKENTDYCVYLDDVKKVITPKKRLCRCSHCKWEYTNPHDGTCGSLVGCSICKHLETHEYIP